MRRKKKPAYLLHLSTGQARVRINGRDIYLGKYGSRESREEYERQVALWFGGQADLPSVSVDDLCILYMEHARGHYRHPNGAPTSELACMRAALRHLVRRFGTSPAATFGPKNLKAVRQLMLDAGQCRTGINHQVNRIKRVFRWAVAEELVPASTYHALACVEGLAKGRSGAAENPPVAAVEESRVLATLAHLPPVLQAMVRLQLLTGMRPGEVCQLRPCDVTIGSDGIWTYRPASHKTSWRGKERRIFIGPAGQDILRPFLERQAEAYCFSPRESESARNEDRRAARRSPMTPSQGARKPKARPKRAKRDRYSKDAYCRAVTRACEAAFGMPEHLRVISKKATETKQRELRCLASEWRREHCWAPNQLRHTAATKLRKAYGIEQAQLVLGHSDPRMTEVYAERNFSAAAGIMRQIG